MAIDGPVGAGKSQVARRVAARLGFVYADTGAMYRTVTLAAMRRGMDLENADAVGALARNLVIRLEAMANGTVVTCDGEDVTTEIRTPEVSRNTSPVADNPAVREAMVRQQQQMAASGGVVMEGRDIGTVVLPDAEYKFYLDASAEERARRRHEEQLAKGMESDYEETFTALQERDRRDRSRPVGALRVADGATVIDSTAMSLDEVVETIVHHVRGRK